MGVISKNEEVVAAQKSLQIFVETPVPVPVGEAALSRSQTKQKSLNNGVRLLCIGDGPLYYDQNLSSNFAPSLRYMYGDNTVKE